MNVLISIKGIITLSVQILVRSSRIYREVKMGLFIMVCFGSTAVNAQNIEKFSIDNGGASVTNGNIILLYTIGEVNVQELNAGNILLSEGFINSNFGETLSTTETSPTENQMRLYPNPAQDVFYVSSPISIKQLTLYDVSGKQIATTNMAQMNVDHLAAGVYVVKISTEINPVIKRLVIK